MFTQFHLQYENRYVWPKWVYKIEIVFKLLNEITNEIENLFANLGAHNLNRSL